MSYKILHFFFASIILFFGVSCSENKKGTEPTEVQPRILMMEVLVTADGCNPDSSNCTYAKIAYPSFTDSTTWILNDFLQNKITNIGADYTADSVFGSIDDLAQTFVDDYERFQRDYPDYSFGWYLNVNSEVILDDTTYVSFRISSEAFTGGAHPNSSLSYYIVNTVTGKPLGITDIIADTVRFKKSLEQAFRTEKGLDESQSLTDLGYFIDDGDFMLTDNIGMTEDDILVHFNSYEIAPYALGSTTITISRESLGDILKLR